MHLKIFEGLGKNFHVEVNSGLATVSVDEPDFSFPWNDTKSQKSFHSHHP